MCRRMGGAGDADVFTPPAPTRPPRHPRRAGGRGLGGATATSALAHDLPRAEHIHASTTCWCIVGGSYLPSRIDNIPTRQAKAKSAGRPHRSLTSGTT